MTLEEKINFESVSLSFYQAYLKLVDLGFDFDKNSAKDLVQFIVYIINHYDFDDDVTF